MAVFHFRRPATWCGLAALALAGCAHGPKSKPAAPPPAAVQTILPSASEPQVLATPGLDPQERLHKLIELLGNGQREQARAEAQQLLKEQPDNAAAANLLNQIDSDPKATLGEQSFPYKIRPGETLSILAERYLGDRYMFYALSRYNGIDAPNQAQVGQTILIPGPPRKLPPPPVLRRRIEPVESFRRPPEAAPAPPPRPAADPGRANRLRSEALVQMNKGAIDRAVALLREAAGLDPSNAAVAADLARAQRIQAATHR